MAAPRVSLPRFTPSGGAINRLPSLNPGIEGLPPLNTTTVEAPVTIRTLPPPLGSVLNNARTTTSRTVVETPLVEEDYQEETEEVALPSLPSQPVTTTRVVTTTRREDSAFPAQTQPPLRSARASARSQRGVTRREITREIIQPVEEEYTSLPPANPRSTGSSVLARFGSSNNSQSARSLVGTDKVTQYQETTRLAQYPETTRLAQYPETTRLAQYPETTARTIQTTTSPGKEVTRETVTYGLPSARVPSPRQIQRTVTTVTTQTPSTSGKIPLSTLQIMTKIIDLPSSTDRNTLINTLINALQEQRD